MNVPDASTTDPETRRSAGRALVAGYGYIGAALGERLVTEGWEVWGLRRSAGALCPAAVRTLQADLADPTNLEALSGALPKALDAVIYLVSSDDFNEDAYRRAYRDAALHLAAALEMGGQQPRWLYASSTGVYGAQDGQWVGEETQPNPQSPTGVALLEAEQAVAQRVEKLTVVRFGGLYGPGRTRLIDQVRKGEAHCAEGPPRYTNRLHREDAAGFLAHLLTLEAPETLYLGVDEEPAARCDVLRFLARAVGREPVPILSREEAPPVRRGNKRCRNRRLVASGYRYLYPNFRAGYGELIELTQEAARDDEPS